MMNSGLGPSGFVRCRRSVSNDAPLRKISNLVIFGQLDHVFHQLGQHLGNLILTFRICRTSRISVSMAPVGR